MKPRLRFHEGSGYWLPELQADSVARVIAFGQQLIDSGKRRLAEPCNRREVANYLLLESAVVDGVLSAITGGTVSAMFSPIAVELKTAALGSRL